MPRRVLHTDGWLGYDRLENHGYRHRITFAKGSAVDPLPRVHRVVSLLKRWLQSTHEGAVTFAHLDYSSTSSRFASTSGSHDTAASCFTG
jgi:hypothetical protein